MVRLTRLRLARLESGLSQHEVAYQTAIFQSILSLYERGLKAPSEQHRKVLSKLYQKPEREILDDN